MTELQIGFVVDAIVTAPIALVTLFGHERAARFLFQDSLPASDSIRMILGSLWMAVFCCSLAGVALPLTMSPILVLQLIYKGLWLALFAIPRWFSGRRAEIPCRLAVLFIAFILVYPWIIPWDWLTVSKD